MLRYRIKHREGIRKVNALMTESESRYSMSNDDEEYDNSPQWSFSIYDGKFLQIQCTNCSTCGEYIKNDDRSKLPTKLLCNVLEHHDNAKFSCGILNIKKNLRYFVETQHIPYMYRASLWAVIVSDLRLFIFHDIFIEYIGLSYDGY